MKTTVHPAAWILAKLHLSRPAPGLRIPVARGSGALPASAASQDYYLVPPGARLAPAQRLVVLLPSADFDERELALKLGRLGRWGSAGLLLVGLARDPLGDNLQRRRMALLSERLNTSHAQVSSALLFRSGWIEALNELLQPHDLLVCLEDHYVSAGFLRSVPLAQHILAKMGLPVCVLQGLPLSAEPERMWSTLREALVWAAMLLTIVCFTLLQIRLHQSLSGAPEAVFQVAAIALEGLLLLHIGSQS